MVIGVLVLLSLFAVISISADNESIVNETEEPTNKTLPPAQSEEIRELGLGLPVEPPVNETEQNETKELPPEELSLLKTVINLILEKLSFIRGEMLEIKARLSYENETPIPDKPINFYVDEEKIGTKTTDTSGLAELFWNTSLLPVGAYTVDVNYSGSGILEGSADSTQIIINEETVEGVLNETANQTLNETVNQTLLLNETINQTLLNTTLNQTTNETLNLLLNTTKFVLPELPVEQCIPEWVELKTTCQRDETIRGFYVDINDCYSLTGNEVDKQAPADNIYGCTFKISKQPIQAPPSLISKDDSEWKIFKQDYVSKYLDFDFMYLNDDYYRVDWKWNDNYVEDVLKRCHLVERDYWQNCVGILSSEHLKSRIVESYVVTGLTREEILNFPCKQKENCTKRLFTDDNITFRVEEQTILNYTKENFMDSYFSEETFSGMMDDMRSIELSDMPKIILKGKANVVGKFNPAKREKGSFYINLKEGFGKSNGLQIKLGINSLLMEFNNSKSTENLSFSGNENITRYLDLDKDTNVTKATLNLQGFITKANGYGYSTFYSSGTYNGYDQYPEVCSRVSVSIDGWYKIASYGSTNTCTLSRDYNLTQARFRVNGTDPGDIIESGSWEFIQYEEEPWCPDPPGEIFKALYNFDIGFKNNNDYFSCVYYNDYFNIHYNPEQNNFYDTLYGTGQGRWSIPGDAWHLTGDANLFVDVYQYPNGSYLEIGTTDGNYEWNHSGWFNESDGIETTNDFADEINSYLTTCTPDANNRCQVPLLFHSNTAGKLQYSDINVTYYNYPRDPSMDAGNDSNINWNYTGDFQTTDVTSDFSQDLQLYLDNDTLCPSEQDNCDIPLIFNSTKGILKLSNLSIQYFTYDTLVPTIYGIIVTPNPANVSDTLTILVNVTDNVNLTKVNATLLTQSTDLNYNSTLELYEGTLIAPTEGIYDIIIIAEDWKNLTSTNSTSINVTSSNAELTLTSDDITYQPSSPLENTTLTINATIYNYGEADANNFLVEFLLDDVSQTNNTISVSAQSSTLTQFTWTTIYGNHNITINADASEIITEDNNSNNQANKTVSVSDAIPPTINKVTANSVTEGTPLTITVNATDNVNINTITAEINNTVFTLGYNPTTSLYENSTTAPDAGTYNLTITATDINGLTTSKQTEIEIYPTQADLTLASEDVILSPLPLIDGNGITITVTIHNKGGTEVNYSNLEFLVDDVSNQNVSLAFASDFTNNTLMPWVAVFGSHTLTFRVDSLNNVSESNENNNELNVSVIIADATAPTINQIITPESVYVNADLPIQVNATDNVNINKVNATLNNTPITLTYNSTSGLYEGLITAPDTQGIYNINVTATDVNGLSSERVQPITINPSEADLTLDASDVVLNPTDPEEPELLEVTVTIRNEGGTDADDFMVRFLVNGNYSQNKNLSVAKASTNITTFNWTSTYSNHTITIDADYTNDITESNESNNIYTKDIFVLDIIPPFAPHVNASPANWTTQTTHLIFWDNVMDTNGIDHYEYQLDYGAWTSVGLNTSFTTPPQPEGIHTVYIRAVDIPGNLGYPGNVSLYIDNSNPSIPVIKEWHCGNDWTQHSTPYYTWTDPGDVGSGVTAYIGELDGQEIELNHSQFYHVNVTSGIHSFKIYAQDALQHNTSWSNIKTVYVDVIKPNNTNITSPTHPDNATWYNITVPTFNFTSGDDHSGLYGFYYVVDNSESTIPDTMNLWTTNTSVNIVGLGGAVPQSNQSENKTGLNDGEWYIHTRAKDQVGNLGDTTHYFFKIDITRPSILNHTPENNAVADNNPPVIIAEYVDVHSGVNTSTIILKLDGNDVTNDAAINDNNITYTPPSPLSDGEHNVLLQIADFVGNLQNYTWSFNVTVNTTEEEARTAIEQGLNNSILTSYNIFTDQQIYVRYLNNTQRKGTFDKVAIQDNQTWAFNCITEGESFTNIAGLYNNTLVIWENQTLTTDQITQQVETLINQTKW